MKENVQNTPNRFILSNSTRLINACQQQSCNDVKCTLTQRSDEDNPCSGQNVNRNEFRLSVNRQQDDKGNSKGSLISFKSSGENNSTPTLIPFIETENDCTRESSTDPSLLGYNGHWLEIKDETIEEIKDKFLPECDVFVAEEKSISSTEEIHCKSPGLDKGWSHFVPGKKYENKRLRRCTDKYTEGCHQYSLSRHTGSVEEEQVASKRKTSFLSICGHDKSPSGEKSSVSSKVTSTGLLGNEETDITVGVSTDWFGSWLEIEDENKGSIELVVIPDESRVVKDTVNSVNKAVLVECKGTVSETQFSSTGNKGHSVTSLSKTNKENNILSLNKCSNKIVNEQGNANQSETSPLGACKKGNLHGSGNKPTEKNTLSDFDFFSTNTDDVESGEGCIQNEDNVDTVLECVSSKVLSSSGKYIQETWECSNCHLLFDSRTALHNHRVLYKHVELYPCTRCNQVFKQAYKLNIHLQKCLEIKCYKCKETFANRDLLRDHTSSRLDNCLWVKCSKCNKRFANRDLLRDHTPSHFVDCNVCGKTFKSENALTVHVNRSHSVKTYLCPECNQSFVSSKMLSVHLRTWHSDKYPQFSCSICKISFVHKSALKYHMNRHFGEKTFFCSDCGVGFMFEKHLKKHSFKHTTVKPWKCSVCSKGFKTRYGLKNHQYTHTGKKRHECADCGRGFLRSSNLRCHMLLHTGEKRFHCDICKGSFFSKPSLMMHMARHLSGQPVSKYAIKCRICCLDMRHLQTSLKTHLKQHTIIPKYVCKGKFDCKVCGKRYKSKHTLIYHLNLHRHTFKCVKCKAVFRNFVNLLCHSYLHIRTKKYQCNICGDRFSLCKDLIGHLEVHTGKTCFKCCICKLRFPKHIALVRHLKQHVKEKQLYR